MEAMAEGEFDPVRMLSALHGAGVRFVLIGGMKEAANREKDRMALPRLRRLRDRTCREAARSRITGV